MKRSTKSLLLFVLIVGALATLSLVSHAQDQVTPGSVRECVVSTYRSQIGVRELTGHNDGEAVEKYLASVGLGKGFAYCASFANWSLVSCGVSTPNSGWCPDWFPKDKILDVEKEPPLPGDVFGIYFPAKGRIAHEGFIDKWCRDKVITVEGNTNVAGSREGDGVYRKVRLRKQISAVSRWIKT